MKRIKDRPITPLLLAQLAEQERRIKECGMNAEIVFSYQYSTYQRLYGSLYSSRHQRCLQPLEITNTPIKPTQNI